MTMQTVQDLLNSADFGARVAEDEVDALAEYFVETSQWRRVYAGERDVVLGPKGSGKSALYSLVVQKSDELMGRNILVVQAENPEGDPVFRSVAADPPTTEDEFEGLWKLYFLSLIGSVLKDWDVQNKSAEVVYSALEAAGLLQGEITLSTRLQAVREYVKRYFNPQSVETTVSLDPTGVPTSVTGKITLREPTSAESQAGFQSIGTLFGEADHALADLDFTVWVVLDRLDVAFARHEELETNALRALFAAYLDLKKLRRASFKIFLRSDIWDRVTEGKKFAEGSHINEEIIEWDSRSLRQLVLRRILRNQDIAQFYDVNPENVYASLDIQIELFARMFPDKIDVGKNPETFDWMLNRTKDGSGRPAPREVIHLLTSLRDKQLRRLELGHEPPPGQQLFERAVFKEALRDVSNIRLTKTLYAEYPDLKPYVEGLRSEKAQQSLSTLSRVWSVDDQSQVRRIAEELTRVGIFERRGTKGDPDYWVPFLYRDALELVQGEAKH